jgi:hypothetical protein
MIEKHYGDARADAEHLDEMLGELETRNPAGASSVSHPPTVTLQGFCLAAEKVEGRRVTTILVSREPAEPRD